MVNRSRFLVLGFFGHETNQLDGQTVKTRNLYILLQKNTSNEVSFFDVQVLKKRRIRIIHLLFLILKSSCIFYLPARNNLNYFFPILFLFAKVFNKKIYYFVIGGWLNEFLQHKPLHKHLLKFIDWIFVETQEMHRQLLKSYSFSNVDVISNFRIHSFKAYPNTRGIESTLKFLFVSRMIPEKGIDVILNFAKHCSEEIRRKGIIIDYYGEFPNSGEFDFLPKIADYEFLSYKGIVNPDQVYQVMSQYDALLFPTRYKGEGFPGVIVEAYTSGIPVIASDWKYNKEFVDEGVTGYLFPVSDEGRFFDILLNLNHSKLNDLKKNAIVKSLKYSAENAWDVIRNRIQSV